MTVKLSRQQLCLASPSSFHSPTSSLRLHPSFSLPSPFINPSSLFTHVYHTYRSSSVPLLSYHQFLPSFLISPSSPFLSCLSLPSLILSSFIVHPPTSSRISLSPQLTNITHLYQSRVFLFDFPPIRVPSLSSNPTPTPTTVRSIRQPQPSRPELQERGHGNLPLRPPAVRTSPGP